MKQTLILQGMPMSLNPFRNAHYRELHKEKQVWELIVRNEAKLQGLKPMQEVNIVAWFHFKDKRDHDPDNYAACLKPIMDGLVKAGIIPDDSFKYVKDLRIREGKFEKRAYITLEMESAEWFHHMDN